MPKVVIVTGASSGIGAATARRLAAQGWHVVAAARRSDRLQDVVEAIGAAGGSAEAATVDVTSSAEIGTLVDTVVTGHGGIDALIANAGVMPLSRLDAGLVEEWNQMIDVNVRGLLYGINAVLPHFHRQRAGHFVTVASIAGLQVSPTSAVYSGTKHAARAITEGLRLESDPSIRVTTITPGVVESELAQSITDPAAAELMRSYRSHAISAAAVAEAIGYALAQPSDVDVNEIVIRPSRQR
ncbi:SDR family oxidoreductase [Mycolicibacterium hodleri]|uniref:SDR family oxidoreductase n=1 Tax=Mycolicibacterium hodleri TaxID=49897 RepID=A0A502DJW7_9MYCO|nr:SDR family oxidoreductase [Mycolicibacterium hodleri]TPG25598.1 SDR family oxidoreductase [Mycolicibacterium hodleri]